MSYSDAPTREDIDRLLDALRTNNRERWLLDWLHTRARAYAQRKRTGKEMDDDEAPPRPED